MVGLNPSTGARSPNLWNHILKGNSKMICLDIPSEENAKKLFKVLQEDELCLGGAITAPYKGTIYHLCDAKTDIVQATGSCNNFYRNKQGVFEADNTDGKGFWQSLKEEIDVNNCDNFIVLGNGGVGRVVTHTLIRNSKDNQKVYTLTRKKPVGENAETEYSMTYQEFIDSSEKASGRPTVLINCTSVGDYTNPEKSLLEEVKELYEIIEKTNIIHYFDCIHTPDVTMTANLFPKKSNGKAMNLYQAVLGFTNVYKEYDFEVVAKKMKEFNN